jgi:hypothetical protein
MNSQEKMIQVPKQKNRELTGTKMIFKPINKPNIQVNNIVLFK